MTRRKPFAERLFAEAGGGAPRSRAATTNPASRFESLRRVPLEEEAGWGSLGSTPADDPSGAEPAPDPRTRLLRDPSRSIVSTNQSPDVGFDASVNPYRGCEHGCIYCYARPTHEYLGFSAGLDFETRILVKPDAPALLRRALSAPGWRPRVVALSGVTDPYQPAEQRLGITRRCLELLLEFRNPVAIITKSWGVTRDLALLQELARLEAVAVSISVTTLDPGLQRVMEPRAAHPRRRLAAIERLAAAGVPVGVMVAPVVPGLTDHELPAIVNAAAAAGARYAGTILLRLPHGLDELFDGWLQEHFPGRRDGVLSRLRALRGGRLNDPRFGSRQRGEGPYAESLRALFALACRRAGLAERGPELSTAGFRRPPEAGGPRAPTAQIPLFASGSGADPQLAPASAASTSCLKTS